MEINPTFHLRGVDYLNILRFYTGRTTPTDKPIILTPQSNVSTVTVNGQVDKMLYNDFNKMPEGSSIIAPVGRNAVISHVISPQSIPESGVCYSCRRKRVILSGVPVSSSFSPIEKRIKFNVIPPWVCSFPCMLSTSRSLANKSEFSSSETLTIALFNIYNPNQLLCEAPDPLLLAENGGKLTDEEYDSCDKIYYTTGISSSINVSSKSIVATRIN